MVLAERSLYTQASTRRGIGTGKQWRFPQSRVNNPASTFKPQLGIMAQTFRIVQFLTPAPIRTSAKLAGTELPRLPA